MRKHVNNETIEAGLDNITSKGGTRRVEWLYNLFICKIVILNNFLQFIDGRNKN